MVGAGCRYSLFESGNRLHQCSKLATASNPSCNCMSATALCSYSNLPQPPLPSHLLSAPSVWVKVFVSLPRHVCASLSLSFFLFARLCVCFCLQCVLVLVAAYATTCGALQQCCISACRLFEGIVAERERTQGLQLYLHVFICKI